MRICLDLTALDSPPSGIRTYVTELSRELRSFEPEIEFLPVGRSTHSGRSGRRLPPRMSKLWWDLWLVGRASARCRSDILHVPQFSAPVRFMGKLIVTVHDVIPLTEGAYRHSRGMRVYVSLMERTVQSASVVIVPSLYVRAEVLGILNLAEERVRVVPMAASDHLSPVTVARAIPEELREVGIDGPYVLNMAGFDVRKNLPLLLEAFARFRVTSVIPYRLVIAGAPHTHNERVYPRLGAQIEALGLGEAVILTGVVSESLKLTLYQHAAMYVTTSMNEGFGMTCLEAMRCGTPVIGMNRTSLPEVIGDGGLLVEPDAELIAQLMERIATDAAFAGSLRDRGLQRAQQFSWEKTARLTLQVYRDAVAG
ncbi:glycosyltransferase family 1 protein [soil metagenome]